MLTKLIEIDKLKALLLSKEQRKLFDYIPKPTIPLDLRDEEAFNENFEIYF